MRLRAQSRGQKSSWELSELPAKSLPSAYEAMSNKGWTQSDLSRAAGVGRDSISNYIRGISLPNVRNLKKLADGLGVEMEDLNPNFSMSAAGLDVPSIQTRALPGDPHFMYLEINCKLPTDVALSAAVIIKNLK